LKVDEENQFAFNNLKIFKIKIPNLRSLERRLYNKLESLMHNTLDEFFSIQIKDYKKDVERRL